MSETVETVKVVTEDGYKIINKSDKKDSDKIYSEQAKKTVSDKKKGGK